MMKDIDFIKKCITYADGFEIYRESDGYQWINRPDGLTCSIDSFIKNTGVLHTNLLTRTIEGINRDSDCKISTNHIAIEAYVTNCAFNIKSFELCDYKSIDDCKRAVIEYVFEQESNNEK